MVQVAFVGSCHALAFDGSANNGEQSVENRHTQNEQRNKQRRQEKVGLTWGVGLTVGVGATPDHTRRHRH